jgi:fructoselysine-6-P-deglycase FrlB-like protein
MIVGLRDEILEQPAAARRLLDSAPTAFAPIAAAVRSRRPRFVVIAARGTWTTPASMRSTCWRYETA